MTQQMPRPRSLKELTLRRNLDLRARPNTQVDFQIAGKQQVEFTSSHAGADLEIPHKLGVVPATVLLGVPSNDSRIYRGAKEWTRTAIYLRSTAACKVDVTPVAPDFPRAVFDGSTAIPASSGGGVPVGANPTAQVSGVAINGVATTFMRSDAAPKLADTAVTPGSYTNANITVDQQGRITVAASGAAAPVGANPTASVGLTVVNGVAPTFMRSDAAPPLSQAIEPTMTGAWIYQPSANNKIPIRIIPHATQNIDIFRTENAAGGDNVAVNKEGILRLRDVSNLGGSYTGLNAPYGGPNPTGGGFLGYGILYVKFDNIGSTYDELYYRGSNDTEVQLTKFGQVNFDTSVSHFWSAKQYFQEGIEVISSLDPALVVTTIGAYLSRISFLNDVEMDGLTIYGNLTGVTFGNNGGKISFNGVSPIFKPGPSGSTSGHVGGGGTVLTHADTWAGGYTITDLFVAMQAYGLLL